ncbi:MAG: hypothetical protein ABI836_14885 [Gemmatimonadota bacterium]
MGCKASLSPLANRLEVGSDSYVIFEAAGEDGQGDLYAAPAGGGPVYPVTFSRAHETAPALSPDGTMLAYIRAPRETDSAGFRVWIMNLLNGSERELPESPAGAPRRVAWSKDGQRVFVRTSGGDLVASAPPASTSLQPASGALQLTADSAFRVLLGDPPFAIVTRCRNDAGLCVPAHSGSEQVLAPGGRDPFQWGGDSVGYFVGDDIEIRPLAGGATRRLNWASAPDRPKRATQFPGVPRSTEPPGLRQPAPQ